MTLLALRSCHAVLLVSSFCHTECPLQMAVFTENYFLLQTISGKILEDNDT